MNDDVNKFPQVFFGVFFAVGLIAVIAYFVFSPYQNCMRENDEDEIVIVQYPLSLTVTKTEYCEDNTSW